MATSVRASCPRCGAVEVPIDGARLVMALQGPDTRNTLTFTCPGCGSPAQQRVTERGTRLLSAAGIVVLAPDTTSVQSEFGGL